MSVASESASGGAPDIKKWFEQLQRLVCELLTGTGLKWPSEDYTMDDPRSEASAFESKARDAYSELDSGRGEEDPQRGLVRLTLIIVASLAAFLALMGLWTWLSR
jgi:hypothetical protein